MTRPQPPKLSANLLVGLLTGWFVAGSLLVMLGCAVALALIDALSRLFGGM